MESPPDGVEGEDDDGYEEREGGKDGCGAAGVALVFVQGVQTLQEAIFEERTVVTDERERGQLNRRVLEQQIFS